MVTQQQKINIIGKLVKEVSQKHNKIIDDFCKAYISSRWQDYFDKKDKKDLKNFFNRLELVQQNKQGEIVYFFRLKRGRLKNK